MMEFFKNVTYTYSAVLSEVIHTCIYIYKVSTTVYVYRYNHKAQYSNAVRCMNVIYLCTYKSISPGKRGEKKRRQVTIFLTRRAVDGSSLFASFFKHSSRVCEGFKHKQAFRRFSDPTAISTGSVWFLKKYSPL